MKISSKLLLIGAIASFSASACGPEATGVQAQDPVPPVPTILPPAPPPSAALTASASVPPPPSASVPAPPSASAAPSAAPSAPTSPALVEIVQRGGLCSYGGCKSVTVVRSDGSVTSTTNGESTRKQLTAAQLGGLQSAIHGASFAAIKARPFKGTCPTAYDGMETIYTFHLPSGDQVLASCTFAIDPEVGLFKTINALM